MSQTKTMTEKSELPTYFREVISGLFNRIPKLDTSKVKIEEFTHTSSLLVSIPKDSRSDRKLFVVVREMVRPSHFETLKSLVENVPNNAVPVIAAPTLSGTVIDECHKRGWGHLDAGGNCLLPAYPFFIEIAGRPIPKAFTSKKKLPKYDLSSELEAKIVRAILRADRLGKYFKDRDVTEWCDNRPSLGYVYLVLRSLASDKYIARSSSAHGFKLDAPASLLRDWAAARAQKPDYNITHYRLNSGNPLAAIDNLDSKLHEHIALSACSALPRLPKEPADSRLYLRIHEDALPEIEKSLEITPAKALVQANLVMMVSKSEIALDGKREIEGRCPRTNLLQTYADLLSLPEGYEAAQELLQNEIRPHFRKAGY